VSVTGQHEILFRPPGAEGLVGAGDGKEWIGENRGGGSSRLATQEC